MWMSLLVVMLIVTLGFSSAATDKIVCYYGSWSVYRNGRGKFIIEDIDPKLCTHLIYTFVGIDENGSIRILDQYNEIDNGGFKRFNALKAKNPNLKTLVAIGGWNEGSLKFSRVAENPSIRKAFVNNAVNFLISYGFDGFDLDWEYPGQRGGSSADKANFAKLVKDFRTAFDKYGYLLTAAVAAAASSVDISYDVPTLSKNLDFINLMAYDLHGSWDKVTGENAPLYPSSIDVTPAAKELNVAACVRAWLERGAPPEKLILGIGIYGRSYTLTDIGNTRIGAPTSGPGNPGPYTQESGMLGYNEICELQLDGHWNVEWNDEQKVPYTYSGNQWIGYDNPRSVAKKIHFAKELRLAGLMIWSIETDDFQGVGGTKYPLLTEINSRLQDGTTGNPPSVTSPPSVSKSTTVSTTTATYITTFVCSEVGYFRDPYDCSTFYYCLAYKNSFIRYIFRCSTGLIYNPLQGACDYGSAIQC